MKQLTAAFMCDVTLPGKNGDQYGLILRVTPSGSKQWIWRGSIRGKRRGATPPRRVSRGRASR